MDVSRDASGVDDGPLAPVCARRGHGPLSPPAPALRHPRLVEPKAAVVRPRREVDVVLLAAAALRHANALKTEDDGGAGRLAREAETAAVAVDPTADGVAIRRAFP